MCHEGDFHGCRTSQVCSFCECDVKLNAPRGYQAERRRNIDPNAPQPARTELHGVRLCANTQCRRFMNRDTNGSRGIRRKMLALTRNEDLPPPYDKTRRLLTAAQVSMKHGLLTLFEFWSLYVSVFLCMHALHFPSELHLADVAV